MYCPICGKRTEHFHTCQTCLKRTCGECAKLVDGKMCCPTCVPQPKQKPVQQNAVPPVQPEESIQPVYLPSSGEPLMWKLRGFFRNLLKR